MNGKGVEKAGRSQVGSLSVGAVDSWSQVINSLSLVGGGRPVLCRTLRSSTAAGFYLLDASDTTSPICCNGPTCHQILLKVPREGGHNRAGKNTLLFRKSGRSPASR